MSSMLEQAIIDAKALRDAAIESAEQVVVERYSNQIKETVESLLEQDEFGMAEDPAMDLGMAEDPAMDMGVEEGPTPEEEDADARFTKDLNEQIPESYDPEINDDQILEIDLNNIELDKDKKIKLVEEEEDTKQLDEEEDEELDEDIELKDEELQELAEALKFDYKPVPDGGFANGQMKPTNSVDDTAMVAEVAAMIEEYGDELKDENAKLKKENKELKTKLKKLIEGEDKLVEAVDKIKEKFDEVQIMNAKLHYTNRAIMDASLNERQKQQIVESIDKADSIEKAKIVFETLQGAVGSFKEEGPKSLSEVVGKRASSSILLKASKVEDKKETTDFARRMKALAGLK